MADNIDTGLVHLAGIQSLSTLNEVLSKLTQEIEVLKDERDEYRRKWLELTQLNNRESIKVKQLPNKE